MSDSENYTPEMRLFDPNGHRLYLTVEEIQRFLKAVKEEDDPRNRVLCQLMVYTGCRPTEALELTAERVLLSEREVVFRTIKKRKYDQRGRLKSPQYRHVPVPDQLIESMDLVFNIRKLLKKKETASEPLWKMSRTTHWSLIKRNMDRADIKGKHATPKGLRHSFGVSMLSGDKPCPINVLSQLMGHTSSKTTEIYLQATGQEKRKLVMQAWE
jgi:integrase/recombinase XerD